MRPSATREARRRLLSDLLRDLRNHRGLRISTVASRLNLAPRSYERFEAGEVRPDLDRVLQFAKIVDADALGLIAALFLLNPELALATADNKLMSALAHMAERLIRELGPSTRDLDTALIVDILDRATDELVGELKAREARKRSWFSPLEGGG